LPQYNLEAALGNIEKQRNGQPPEPLPPVTAPDSTALDTLGMNLQRAATANPQDEAKRRKLAGQLGMPTAILPPTPDAESQAFLKNTQAQEIMAKYPALAKWAQNPDNAAVAGKDLPTLGNIEETAKSLPQIALGYGKNLAGSAAAAFPNANAAVWSFVQAAGAILSTNATKPLADQFGTPDVGAMLATTALDMRKRATQIGKDLAPDTSGMGTIERGIYSGVQSAATTLMTLPLSIASGSPVPTLSALSAITAGQSLGEAIDKGLPLNEALIHATKQGLIEYGTELFPVGNLLKNLTAKTGLIQTATQFMIREGIGEQAATVLQDLDKWATLNPEKPFSEYLAERPEAALETLIATAVGGSIQVGGAKAVAKGLETMQRASTVDLGRAQRAEENHGILMGLGGQAAGHPLRERDPQAFHDFMSTMTEDGNLSDVYIDGKTLANVLNQSGVSEQEINRKMPEVAQQLGEAAKTNGEVRISLADYATYIAGTDVEKGIIEHLRASPDGMTYTEAQQFYQSQKDDLSKQAEKLMSDVNTTEAYKQDVQQVHDTILEQMNKAGRFTADVNAAYAVPFREFYAVNAAKMGITPSELYKQLPLNFAPMNAGNILNQGSLPDLESKLTAAGIKHAITEGKNGLTVSGLIVPKDKRGQGVGSQAMADILNYADSKGVRVTLTPSTDFGGSSVDRLKKFYKQFGFVENKGKNKDFTISDTMYREPQVLNQSVFHGTPHVWAPEPGFPHGRPRLDKMGTGEGAQAFGWGWYSAENGAVAEGYRKLDSRVLRADGTEIITGQEKDAAELAAVAKYKSDGDRTQATRMLEATGRFADTSLKAKYDEAVELLLDNAKLPEVKPAGQLYSLDIPDSVLPRLLDWDKPLSEQTPEVRKALKSSKIWQDVIEEEGTRYDPDAVRFYEMVKQRTGKSDKAASEYLASIGIVGNRYLDGGSRADGKGTYNYVIWDQPTLDKVALLERNGEKLDAMRELAQGNRAGYNPDTFTISLLKGADLSSTLHEGGHFYLEALAELAGRPDAPQQIKDDFRKTLDWFGITGNENLGTGVRGGDLGQSPLNENFKKWFGDSKVVDADGKPLVVYHGTNKTFDKFDLKKFGQKDSGWYGKGIYLTADKHAAAGYATFETMRDKFAESTGANIMPVYVSLKNPYYWPKGRVAATNAEETKAITEELMAAGYDGVIVPNEYADPESADFYEVIAFNSNQIKSAIGNNGEFSGDNILNQGGEPGTPGDLPPGRTPEEVWNSMSLDQKRPYHEQWAQSFERYMLEGKAPTAEMQPVFARFRAWMLNVYKSLEAFLKQNPLAGKLNDEVRGIFDRLIASEESIRATESVRAYAPLFESNEAAGVTPKQFQDYLDLGEAATERAIDDLSSRSLRDMKWLSNAKERVIKDLQKEAKAKRKAVEAEVTQEVMSEPVNQARTFLKTGEMTDPATGDLIKAEAGFKLDKTAVDELFPVKGTVTLDRTKLRGMTQEDGLSPDLAAQMFGFSSGEALIAEIANGESAKDKIEAMTDQRMLERYGDLSSEEDIERAAEAAIHNEARARFLATGLAMLTKSPIPAAQLNKAAKQAAENTIASRKVRDLRPAQYERAETKANKEAIKLAPKDPKGAMEAQRAALLNNRLAKASGEAVQEVEKILRYVEKFNTDGTRKALDIEYLEQIDDLLRPFDFRKGQSLKQIDKRQSLADWIDEQEAMGFEPAIDPALMDEAKLKSYKNMTLEELRGLVDSIKQIEHLGRLKRKLLLAKDQREFDEIVAEGIRAIHDNANRTVEEKATPTDAIGIAGKWWRQMTADHRKFASIMREMDGGKDNGFMFNRFLRTMNESGDSETQMKAEATDALAKLFKAIDKNPVPGNLYTKKRVVPGTNLSMTHEQRIMFAMNWGNEGNRQRLLDGGLSGNRAISLPQAQAVLDTLTKEEWDFVQGVWDFIAEYKPQVAALERRITGVEPEWVEPSPIRTKHGTYRGGYFPVKYDTELSSRSESLEAANDLRMGMKGAFNSAATRSGFTKARADQVINRPILLSYNAISQHVSEVTHRLAWQEWLIDTNRLLKALDNPIREHYGAEILRTLRDTVVDIAAGDAPAKNGTETAINRLRVGSTVVGMGWRVTTALLQPSGLAQSWVRVGGKYIARGVYQFTKSPITSGEFVNSKSKMMVDRGRTMQREINEVLNTVRAGDKVSAFKASYFSMIGKMQRAVDIPTWLGAYEKATDELKLQDATTADERKAIEEQASALADQAVLDSQSGGQLKDLAKVQRGSPLQKIFTNFYSYFSATYNLNVEAVRRTDFKSPSQVAMLATDMVLLNSVPVLFSVALKELLKGECGDDLECLGKKLGHEQLSFLFGQMVLLREAGTAIDVAAGGQGFGYQGPAGLRFFGDLYKAGQQVNQGDADMAFFKSANNVAGALLHYPAGQINATVEGIMAIEQGKVEGMGILPAIIAGPPKK
jgi:GNAT superfamily N-acetyltransferase